MHRQPIIDHSSAGFTLVEMAVVMVVIGLVMMSLLPALNAVRTANQTALTQSNLRSLMLATAAFVQANGCLPCPANPAARGTNFGRMGYSASTIACGTCAAPEGIVPFVSLGLPATAAHDGWGHWITMRVDPALTSLPSNSATCSTTNTCSAFVPPTSLCTVQDVSNGFCTSAQIGYADKGLCRTGIAATNRISVTTPASASQQAAVIFVSHGATGYGSFFAQAKANASNGALLPFPSNYAACSSSGGYAQCNAAQTTTFVDAPITTGNADPYDDVLAYADRNSLVSLLGNAACQTVW